MVGAVEVGEVKDVWISGDVRVDIGWYDYKKSCLDNGETRSTEKM